MISYTYIIFIIFFYIKYLYIRESVIWGLLVSVSLTWIVLIKQKI